VLYHFTLQRKKVGFNLKKMNLTGTNINSYLMEQMGVLIIQDPSAVADLLEANDIELDTNLRLDPITLTNAYVENLPDLDSLQLGTAYLVNRNENSSLDGTVDNDTIYDYFDAISEHFDDYSNVGGAIAGVLGASANLGSKILEGKQKKRFAGTDLAQKQAESRQAIVSGIMAQKQADALAQQKKAEAEQKAKHQKNIIIGSIIGLTVIVGAILIFKMKKNG
jgi:hypothetical protein